ncbi:MAG: secretin and TonB N-terminal domain-containing protein [Candidatus Omnitrophica bacterium]|nr:secretin and TonB N-terminal domain-containing protein [Candidatus Omnitrophota bacterium]
MKTRICVLLILLSLSAYIPASYTQELTGISENKSAGGLSSGPVRRVSVDFENAMLKDVLKVFSRQTGANFIASNVIENKTVTVYLSDVSIDEALSSILKANGLTYEKQGADIYLIKPSGDGVVETITKTIKLNYIQVYTLTQAYEEEGFAATSSSFSVFSEGASSESPESSFGAPPALPAGPKESAPGEKVAENIIDVIKSLMSKHGKIVADKRTNSLIITEIPERFEIIEKIIKELDIEPPQVLIQAELLETTTEALKRVGIEYGSLTETWSVKYGIKSGSDESQRLQIPTAWPFLTENFIKDAFGTSLMANAALFNYGTITAGDMEIILKLIIQDQDTKYLSRPKILTLNNEPAVIEVSANTAIGTESTTISQTGDVLSKAERVKTGVILKVTPQVNPKNEIFMYLEPSVIRAQTSEFFSTTFLDPQVRSARSTVLVKDGDTVVIGGLIKTNNYKTMRKVPFLGDIPILGEPFKSSYKKIEDTELLIFITPHIVKKRGDALVMPPEIIKREETIKEAMQKYSKEKR